MAETRQTPAPGRVGRIHLTIDKDRPGRLREVCGGNYAGTFVLDSRLPHATTISIEIHTIPTTSTGAMRPTLLMERISTLLEEAGRPLSGKQITDAITGRPSMIRAALARLVEEGHISITTGSHGAHMHHLITTYRETDDTGQDTLDTPPPDQDPPPSPDDTP